ncbi:MAG: hypothetical protein AAFP19_11530 [Bacteroidota bacterium]
MTEHMNMDSAVLLASIIASFGILYNTVELYLGRKEILKDFYNWRLIKSRYYLFINRPTLSLVFDFLFARKTFLRIVIVHGIAAILFPLVFYFQIQLAAILALIVLLGNGLVNIRLLVGRDGSDQMQNILWAGFFVYCLPLSEMVQWVALWFIAAQLILSYLTSGYWKLVSKEWRRGVAIHLVTRMATYSPHGISRFFSRPIFSISFSWLTIIFELFSPLLLFFGVPGATVFIILGTLFHLGIGITMGLTTFVFAFVATYPIIYTLVQ